MHNLCIAKAQQYSRALDMYLHFYKVIKKKETIKALINFETKHSKLDRVLLPIFFPGELLPQEKDRWDALRIRSTQQDQNVGF